METVLLIFNTAALVKNEYKIVQKQDCKIQIIVLYCAR